MLRLGSRVEVRIADYTQYATGAAECLDKLQGTIEHIGQGHVLVRFDQPAKTWWKDQTPSNAFWFDTCDIVEL